MISDKITYKMLSTAPDNDAHKNPGLFLQFNKIPAFFTNQKIP